MMRDWMHDPDALALLDSAKANPLEKTIRYILADKIQELGDEEVAIAIRKSMSTDRWGGRDVKFAEKVAARMCPWSGCVNGWLAVKDCPDLPDSPWLCAVVWTEESNESDSSATLIDLANSPVLRHVVHLDMAGYPLGSDEAVIALATSKHLENLSSMDLTFSEIGDGGAIAIADSRGFRKLITLELVSCGIGTRGARAIARSKYLTHLRWLSLRQNRIGPKGAKVIAESPTFAKLETLNIGECDLGEEGAVAIATSKTLTGLAALDLSHTPLSDKAVHAIANSPTLGNLTGLYLDYCDIGEGGAAAIANSPKLQNLSLLFLGNNPIGGAGAIALASTTTLTNLETLDLSDAHLGGTEIRVILTSPAFASLTTLGLSFNYVSDEMGMLLAKARVLKNLEFVDLRNCGTSDTVIAAILRSKKLTQLQQLLVLECDLDEESCRKLLERFAEKLDVDRDTGPHYSHDPLDMFGEPFA